MNAVTTSIFRIPSSVYVATIMSKWLRKYFLLLCFPFIAIVILGMSVDSAFYFVALMLLFLLYPAILMMVYYNYALTLEARAEILPHSVAITSRNIKINRYAETKDKAGNTEYTPKNTDTVNFQEISDIYYKRHYIVLRLGHRGIHVLHIPLDSIRHGDLDKAFSAFDSLAGNAV